MNDSTPGPQDQQLWNSLLRLVELPIEAWPKFKSFYSAMKESDEPKKLLDDFFRQHAVDVRDREKALVLVMAHYKAGGNQELLDDLLLAAEKHKENGVIEVMKQILRRGGNRVMRLYRDAQKFVRKKDGK